jgi:hypothetical protein
MSKIPIFLLSTQLNLCKLHKNGINSFKRAPGVLALIRKGFTMAQNVRRVISYISAVENF